jgi:hypothetical protein
MRDLVQEGAVGRREQDQAEGEQQPRGVGAPGGQRERSRHDRQQSRIRDRVGEVRDHGQRLAGGCVDHARKHDCSAKRCHRQSADHPVKEQARSELVFARSQQ